MLIPAHTYAHKHPLGRVKVHCREDWKVEGHSKWRYAGPDLAPGMMGRGRRGRDERK